MRVMLEISIAQMIVQCGALALLQDIAVMGQSMVMNNATMEQMCPEIAVMLIAYLNLVHILVEQNQVFVM